MRPLDETTDDELHRLGVATADVLAETRPELAGIVRQMARRIAAGAPADADACPVCGARVAQPATGRRRVYCSPRCRDRARRGTAA